MKLFLLLLLVLVPGALFGQYLEGTWHVVRLPQMMLLPSAEMSFIFTTDSILMPMSAGSDTSDLEDMGDRVKDMGMKIVARSKSRAGDTATYIVKGGLGGPKDYTGLRFVREMADRVKLSFAEKAERGKKPRFPKDSEYMFFGTMVSDAKFAELGKLSDPATITKEHVIVILKDVRATLANMAASHDFRRRMHETMGYTLLIELTDRITTDLEALGYSPVRWTKTPDEIIALHRNDSEVAQLIEELRQITDTW